MIEVFDCSAEPIREERPSKAYWFGKALEARASRQAACEKVSPLKLDSSASCSFVLGESPVDASDRGGAAASPGCAVMGTGATGAWSSSCADGTFTSSGASALVGGLA